MRTQLILLLVALVVTWNVNSHVVARVLRRKVMNLPWVQSGSGVMWTEPASDGGNGSDTKSGHAGNWDYKWAWGSSPGTGWGFGSGSSRSSNGNGKGFGFGSGTGSGTGTGSGSGFGFGFGSDDSHGTDVGDSTNGGIVENPPTISDEKPHN